MSRETEIDLTLASMAALALVGDEEGCRAIAADLAGDLARDCLAELVLNNATMARAALGPHVNEQITRMRNRILREQQRRIGEGT